MINFIIDLIFGFVIAAGVIYTFLLLLIMIHEFRFPRKSTSLSNFPEISILKPLKGLEDHLEDNLRSFFTLNYPKYEILFGVNEIDDPSIPVVTKLCREYPNLPTKLIIDTRWIGLNPKINNLFNIYQKASYDYILISDSNVRVDPSYLRDMVTTMNQPNTGLVTSTIRGISARRIGSILDNLYMNSFVAPSVFLIKRIINLPISIGKSMLFRREILEKIGGFQALRNVLAEDHLLGEAIRQLGLEVRISAKPVNSVNENWSIQNFISRHSRWAKLRRNLNPIYYFFESLAHPIAISLVYLLLHFNPTGLFIFSGVLVYKITVEMVIDHLLQSDLKWYHYLFLPLKDIVMAGIWFIPYVSRTVSWRGNKFKIEKNTILSPII